MFEDDVDERVLNEFKVNKKFEERFNKKQGREEVDKAKAKYGKNYHKYISAADDSDYDSGSSLDEDENATLFNDKVAAKFMKTLTMLKKKDPRIYEKDTKFFDENDFGNEESLLGKHSKYTKFTYKDQVRKDALEGLKDISENDDDEMVEETPFQEQNRVKNEFKQAAEWASEDQESEDETFLKKKLKTENQEEQEEEDFDEFLKKKGHLKNKSEVAAIKEVWGKEGQLSKDKDDEFLRNFILKKGWVDTDENMTGPDYTHNPFEVADKEDEARDEEVNDYERKINFRFEEDGGTKIKTYERDIADTLRRKDTKRSEKRKEKQERKKIELDEFKQEADMMKKIKKGQIEEKIRKIVEVAGMDMNMTESIKELMKGEFDEDKYEETMNKMFDDEYFEKEDENEEDLKRYVDEIEDIYDRAIQGEKPLPPNPNKPQPKEGTLEYDKEMILNPKPSIPISLKKKLNNVEAKEMAKNLDSIWFYCDNCYRGLKPLEPRFDCMECSDYSECKQCSGLKTHTHKMKKFIVPEGCVPPSDDEILEILGRMVLCNKCEEKLDDTTLYYKHNIEEDYFLCEACMNYDMKNAKDSSKNFTKIAPKHINPMKSLEEGNLQQLKGKNPLLDRLIEDYEKIDFEDVIAGGLKTRFHYTDVSSDGFLLDDDELLFCDDNLLNKYMSIKKFAPYADLTTSK